MKQKEIVIDRETSPDAEELITALFAVKRVNGIEGFILSYDEFSNKYKGTYAFQEFLSSLYHLVYTIDKCDVCFKSFDVTIYDLEHFDDYANARYKLCDRCKFLHNGPFRELGMRLDGDIAY
ncbi:hypothetical protein DSM02_3825 [Leeuwenhoekiella polynyae]|uniref:Uncharacterized protein n=2 Tax=Leeuwenhoekiella polynyae TaxID=1550906 RepID=A0A4Q0NQP9_9FLAO|nr:hypothetical protein DSM02_3825 [Leeuwenhoekiella polynyae]